MKRTTITVSILGIDRPRFPENVTTRIVIVSHLGMGANDDQLRRDKEGECLHDVFVCSGATE